jgi:hypothetical protein
MRRAPVLLIATVLLAAGCSQSDPEPDAEQDARSSTATAATPTTATSAASTSPSPSEGSGEPGESDSVSPPAPGGEYLSYANGRFGFACQVPGYFVADEGPVEGDGRGFTGPDLASRVVCSGTNTNGRTAAQGYADAQAAATREGTTVSQKALQGDTFTLSGTEADGDVYYRRTVWGSGSSNTLLWTYPPELGPDLDPAVTHSAETFEPGDVSAPH